MSALYTPASGVHDEALEPDGTPRPHYASLLAELDGADLARRTAESVRSAGVRFGDGFFALDPVPRIVTPDEWSELQVGITQRVRALDMFLRDVYGEGRILDAGVVPRRVVEAAPRYEPAMRGAEVRGNWISVVGLDVVRCADGRFRIIEDQVRMPSGIAYTVAAREVFSGLLSGDRADPSEGFALLGAALRAATDVKDPSIVIVSEGESSAAWWEHERLGRELGLPVVTLDDLPADADVIYQRTAEDCPEPLLDAARRGTAVVNAPGCGVADDKFVNAYVADMVRFYLDEELLLPAVPTYDMGNEDARAEALERLDELVLKPRGEMGGEGVVLWRDADRETRERMLRDLERSPEGFIAQELVTLSTHPTLVDGELRPRHVDLRPYAFLLEDEVRLMPGALTRVALEEGSMIVNSGQGGGAKDSWIPAS